MIDRLQTVRTASASFIIGAMLLGGDWTGAAAQQPTAPPLDVPKKALPADPLAPAAPQMAIIQAGQSLDVLIDPKAPPKDLLPPAPKPKAQKPSAFVDRLADVPELMLTEPIAESRWTAQPSAPTILASQLAKINYLNKEKPDRFMELLLAGRPDLAGLPFQMGSECRQSKMRGRYFKEAVTLVHRARNGSTERQTGFVEPAEVLPANAPPVQPLPNVGTTDRSTISRRVDVRSSAEPSEHNGAAFLAQFLQLCVSDDNAARPSRLKEHREQASPARVAAIMQICGPTSNEMKLAMSRYLASVSSVDSTRALVKTILFTPEEESRDIAIEALKARRDKDYVDGLMQGFRYPWPDVAKRAGDALVKLERKDLVPQLVDILDEPDPRAPVTKKVDGKSVTSVREIVRINHHRNCALCHAPGMEVANNSEILTAESPEPSKPLPSFESGGYRGQGVPELLVRIDVTYLRQDFSATLPVADAAPWPEMQRFDFVARSRVLKDDEVQAYKDKFDKLEPGWVPPNHRAALMALRELTGKDAAPTAEAWRSLLQAAK